jgi:uncharacterized protein YceK
MLTNLITIVLLLLVSLLPGCGALGNQTPQQAQSNGQALQQQGVATAQQAAGRGDVVGTDVGLIVAGIGTILGLFGTAKSIMSGATANRAQTQVDQLYDATHAPIAQLPPTKA